MITVAEIGINHNGDIEIAKQMIRVAKAAGCDYVKFQKRTVDVVYTKEELDRPRESPWGTTNRDQKNGLEFDTLAYNEIDKFCDLQRIQWFASPWDPASVDFLCKYKLPYMKVASACVTDLALLERISQTSTPVILSTGMSTKPQVDRAIEILRDQIEFVLACTSTYPCCPDEMNLRFIARLHCEYPQYRIGFSNHSPGLTFCIAAAALGAEMVEFHITLDRASYGSDQAASIETGGVFAVVKHLHNVEKGMGTGEWTVFESEKQIAKKLRHEDTNS